MATLESLPRPSQTSEVSENLRGLSAQAALRALKAGDEEGLVAALMTTKWSKTGYQAMVTIEETFGDQRGPSPIARGHCPCTLTKSSSGEPRNTT